MTLAHKALTSRGVKPLCVYQHKFENTYLYGAFSPFNGKHLVLELPCCNTENFQAFLDEFSAQDKEEFKILLLDNAAFHKAQALAIPANIHLEFLPKYNPESNPAEKVWWRIKRELKTRFFKTFEGLQEAMSAAVKKIVSSEQIIQLCAFDYLQTAFMT